MTDSNTTAPPTRGRPPRGPGRPAKLSVSMTITFPLETAVRLAEAASAQDRPVPDVIRDALAAYVANT